MCIAAIISEPISREYLAEMNKDNPHGGGVAWVENNLVRFERGLDDAAIWDLQQNGVMTYPYFLHFRWATHGDIVPQLTHPFPIGPRALFGELSGYAKSVLIHNGVWMGYLSRLNDINAPKALLDAASDTAIAAYLLGTDDSFIDKLDSIPWATAIMAVDEEGKQVIGEFGYSWTSYKGNRYSNLQWLPAGEWWSVNGKSAASRTSSSSTPSHLGSGWDWESCDWGTPVTSEESEPKDDAWKANKDLEPFVDDYLTTNNKQRKQGALEVIKCFDDWQDYVRWRYGDEIANEIVKDDGGLPVDNMEDYDSPEFISEEAAVVNAYLERLERKTA